MQKQQLLKILNVLQPMHELAGKRFSNWAISIKLTKALKELETQKDIYVEKETTIVNHYGLKDENGKVLYDRNGQPKFKDVKTFEEFQKELLELQHTEVEIFDTILLNVNDFKPDEAPLNPNQIIALEGFVDFDIDEEGGKA